MFVEHEVDGVRVVRLETGKVNALNADGFDALAAKAMTLTQSPAVVLTGSGSVFSAGVDLRSLVDGGKPYAERLVNSMTRAYTAWFDLGIPVVAAINGHAIAGGAVLAAVADHRVMGSGRIGLTEITVGVPFPPATLEIMRHALGSRLATVVLNAQLHEVAPALRLGLIDELVGPDQVLDRAVERARILAMVPPAVFATTKAALREPARSRWSLEDDLTSLAAQWSQPETLDRIRSQI